MKKTKWKLFFDYEKEETWLNEMSAKGLAFTGYFPFRYSFAECKPGEYVYRIELLDKSPSNPESEQYLKFMEEGGAEQVSTWYRWVYFRKRSDGGKFEIYNDIDSKLTHYKRVYGLFLALVLIEILMVIIQLGVIAYDYTSGEPLSSISFFVIGFCLGFGIVCVFLWNMYRKKIKNLKQAKKVWE